MQTPPDEFEQLGQALAEEQDRWTAQRQPAWQARGPEQLGPPKSTSMFERPALVWMFAPVLSAAVAVMAVWLWRSPEASPMAFRVDGETGTSGQWVTVPAQAAPTPLSFDDGTKVELRAGSRARVLPTGSHSARLMLDAGHASLNVQHHPDTEWLVDAGPFSVQVHGTQFEVLWSPPDRQLQVALKEGKVSVRGPLLKGTHFVAAGSALWVSLTHDSVRTLPLDAPAPRWDAAAAPSTPQATGAEERDAPKPRKLRRVKPKPNVTQEPSWQELASVGKFDAAFASAKRLGFAQLVDRLDAPGLMRLSEVARFAGHWPEAKRALIGLRRRFGASAEASTAAYTLGRQAFDHERDYSAAVRHFESYLRERPNGGLAREALGRVLEAHVRAKHPEQARVVAKRYLQRFPAGPHAELARQQASSVQPQPK